MALNFRLPVILALHSRPFLFQFGLGFAHFGFTRLFSGSCTGFRLLLPPLLFLLLPLLFLLLPLVFLLALFVKFFHSRLFPFQPLKERLEDIVD